MDLEILLGEVGPGRPVRHFCDQGAPGVGKLLAGVTIPIGYNLGQKSLPCGGLIPIDLRSALETGRQVPGIALPLGSGGQFPILYPGQRAQQLTDAVRQKIVGVLHRHAPPDGCRVQGYL